MYLEVAVARWVLWCWGSPPVCNVPFRQCGRFLVFVSTPRWSSSSLLWLCVGNLRCTYSARGRVKHWLHLCSELAGVVYSCSVVLVYGCSVLAGPPNSILGQDERVTAPGVGRTAYDCQSTETPPQASDSFLRVDRHYQNTACDSYSCLY